MACCRPGDPDSGYATPAALVLSLALSIVAVALVGRSTALLRLTEADLERTQVEFGLDGAHLAAAAAIVRTGAGGPYRWTFSTDIGWVDVLAEPEAEKLTPAAASELSDERLLSFDVRDPARLKQRLRAIQLLEPTDIASLDDGVLWKRCGPSLVSSFGAAQAFVPKPLDEPISAGQVDPAWRIGEVWRISITTASGWRDDRVVRFTGDARGPAAVVARWFSRTSHGGQGQCSAILSGI